MSNASRSDIMIGVCECARFISNASRLDIMVSVCLCARYQSSPKEFHLKAVRHIFRYLKGTTDLGL